MDGQSLPHLWGTHALRCPHLELKLRLQEDLSFLLLT